MLALLSLFTPLVQAAPPNTTGLMPAGGQRGATVEVTAIGSFDTWPTRVWTSSPYLVVEPGKEKGKLTIKIAPQASPGIYWLRFYDNSGAGQLRPFIVGTLPEFNEMEPNEDARKAPLVQQPAVVNGKLNKNGDVDCFAVNLKNGQTLVASVQSHQVLRSAADMVMQLVTPNGVVIAQNHDYHGLDPQIHYSATKDEQIVVRLFAFPANPDSSIRFSGGEHYFYRLTLTTEGFADYALPLAVNISKPEPIRLVGWNLTPKTMVGTPISEGDFATVFHPQVTGIVPVRREHWPTYDATLPGQSKVASFSAPMCLTAQLTKEQPVSVTKFNLTKGRKLLVQVLSNSLDLDLDPVLTIKDEKGTQVLTADSKGLNSDLLTTFTPAQDGIYSMQVYDLLRRHGDRMTFLLRLGPEEPDYSLSLDTDRYTMTLGKPLDIPVKIALEPGFKEEVLLSVEGVPADVQSKVVSTSPDKKVITLRLEAKEPLNSGFRIVGTTKVQPTTKKVATAVLPDLATSTTRLWLTVLMKK